MASSQWTPDRAWEWYRQQPWLVGCNFLPSTAINQLEMFQPSDFDEVTLARELDWARDIGMNTLRVFLHDLLWEADPDGFKKTLDRFLDLCSARAIRPMLVFFDACHRPEPKLGKQPEPIPGIHNPGWAQSPNVSVLRDRSQWSRLERYLKEVLAHYGTDERVLCWDLYNEPCNGGFDGNDAKARDSAELVEHAFAWAREAAPSQPLTICVWTGPDPLQEHDESALEDHALARLHAQRYALQQSDFVSFHHYGHAEGLENRIRQLLGLGRPVVCTEYMARQQDSFFQSHLPILARHRVGAYNWGFVSGKSQTIFPWGTPEGTPEPNPWFHDIFRPDGTPFDSTETAVIQALTLRENG